MSFPFEFVKPHGDYDFVSPMINLTASSAIICVGGVSLAAIAGVAMKALGVGKTGLMLSSAVPVSMIAFGAIGVCVGGLFCFSILEAFRTSYRL